MKIRLMSRTRLLSAILAAVWAASMGATAQAETVSLHLDQAIERALLQNERAGIAALRDDRARAVRLEAWSRLLPHVNTVASLRRRPEVRRDIGGTSVAIQGGKSKNLAATGSLTIFDATALADIVAAGDAAAGERQSFLANHLDLAHAVAEAYVGAYTAAQLVKALQDRVAVAERSVAEAAARVRSGLAPNLYLKRIQLELAAANVELAQAKVDADTMRLMLQELAVLDAAPALTEPALATVNWTFDTASPIWRDRPELEAVKRQAESAQAALNSARLAYLPTLGLGADWSTTDDPGISGRNDDWSILAAARWSIFEGAGRWARLKQRAADAGIAELEYSAAIRQADLAMLRLGRELEAAEALVQLVETQLDLARETADETSLRFRNNLATALELAEALAQQHLAASDSIKQRLNLDLARLQLARALGLWPTAAAEKIYKKLAKD